MHGKIFPLQGLLPGTGGISLLLSSGGIWGNALWKWYWGYQKNCGAPLCKCKSCSFLVPGTMGGIYLFAMDTYPGCIVVITSKSKRVLGKKIVDF